MLNRDNVTFTITAEPKDIAIEGNALASGDPVEDRGAEDWIREQLEAGNEWAWCCVKVTASVEGIALEGTDYLGACSYLSEADFTTPGGYYDDMKGRAVEDLEEQIKEACERITKPLAMGWKDTVSPVISERPDYQSGYEAGRESKRLEVLETMKRLGLAHD